MVPICIHYINEIKTKIMGVTVLNRGFSSIYTGIIKIVRE